MTLTPSPPGRGGGEGFLDLASTHDRAYLLKTVGKDKPLTMERETRRWEALPPSLRSQAEPGNEEIRIHPIPVPYPYPMIAPTNRYIEVVPKS